MKHIIIAISILACFSCNSKPKVIVEDTQASGVPSGGTDLAMTENSATSSGMHQVTALEIMHAEKYTYMRVVENSKDTFWIAASKMEAQKGRTYFYKGGLMKTNFHSQEFNRDFDKIYLVSSVIDASAHPGGNVAGNTQSSTSTEIKESDIKTVAGSVKLSDLFSKKKDYEGKVITVSGKCVKTNNGIMGKNWIHIQDGSKAGGKLADLTITSNATAQVGANVAFEGKIILNKDFGAGYRYDIIMEDAVERK